MGVPKKFPKAGFIGKKIMALREAKGISRKGLSQLLGDIYSYDALTKVEMGKVKAPPLNVLKRIAEILEVPLEEFLREDEEVVTTQDLLNDPDLNILMYGARDLSPRDRRILLKVLEILKKENEREREGNQSS